MNKKYFFIIFIILCCISLLYFTIQYFDIFHTIPIVSLNNLETNQYEDRTDISYIKNIKYGKIISKEKKIDTSKPGKKKLIIIIENNYGKSMEYQFFITIKKKEK